MRGGGTLAQSRHQSLRHLAWRQLTAQAKQQYLRARMLTCLGPLHR